MGVELTKYRQATKEYIVTLKMHHFAEWSGADILANGKLGRNLNGGDKR